MLDKNRRRNARNKRFSGKGEGLKMEPEIVFEPDFFTEHLIDIESENDNEKTI